MRRRSAERATSPHVGERVMKIYLHISTKRQRVTRSFTCWRCVLVYSHLPVDASLFPAGSIVCISRLQQGRPSIKIRLHPAKPFVNRDQRPVTEVALSGGDTVAVRTGQLSRHEPRHRRVVLSSEKFPCRFKKRSDSPSRSGGNPSSHWRQASTFEDQIDPVPEIDGLRFVNEIGAARRRR